MRHALRRLGFFAVTLWACLTLNFVLPRLMPGSPILDMMAKYRGHVTPKALDAIEAAFGIETHTSLFVQYWQYLGNTFTGNFGISLHAERTGKPGHRRRGLVDARPDRRYHGAGVRPRHADRHHRRVAARRLAGRHPAAGIRHRLSIPFFWIGMLLILLVAKLDPRFPDQRRLLLRSHARAERGRSSPTCSSMRCCLPWRS